MTLPRSHTLFAHFPRNTLRSVPPHLRNAVPRRSNSTFSALRTEMLSRRPPLIYDDLSPMNSYKLQVSLAPFLPPSWTDPVLHSASEYTTSQPTLPPSHHLVYFNPAIESDRLLPDGTDPLQSPGEPYVRRMWAGGSVRFREGWNKQGEFAELNEKLGRPLAMTRKRYVCMERIRDVQVKGREGDEKVFVGIERRVGVAPEELVEVGAKEDVVNEDALRERLWSEDEEGFAESVLIEKRNIVFMRERTPKQAREAVAQATTKMLKAQNPPQFTHSLVPTASLLFRYSALTFNAHAIHLDPQYCREIEGHRNLLFHGPLSLTLLLTMLNARIGGNTINPDRVIKSIDYRNLAPLYSGEELKLCGREVEEGSGKYELWVENNQGGICVRGIARTAKSS